MKIKNNYIIVLLISFFTAGIMIIPSIIDGDGILSISADFNYQQIPFGILSNNLIKEGNVWWNWYNDLGTSFIGSFSFYNLGSIFFWITIPFKADAYPYLIGPILIIKYVVSSITSYAYIQRYVKNKNYAIIGAFLYSFSGFQITNMLFNHFHDVVALFPLLLIGMDKLILDKKKGMLIFAVAICAINNYFFFIGQVVFVILYFIIKLITKEYKLDKKIFIQLAIESIIGFGISSVIFIPSILFIVGNARVSNSWELATALKMPLEKLLEIARATIMPPEIMTCRSIIAENNWTSVEMYLPFVGTILYFTYIWKEKKSWISILIVISFIFMVVPILNSTFFALTNVYYARWLYMPILIMSLASAKTLDDKKSIKSGFILTGLLTVIFGVLILYFKSCYPEREIILRETFFIRNILVLLFGIIGIFLIDLIKKKENIKIMLLILCVSVFSIYTGIEFFHKYENVASKNVYNKIYLNESSSINMPINDGERIDSTINVNYNIGYLLKFSGIKNWNSTIDGDIFELYKALGIGRDVATVIDNNEFELRDFLSVKYIIESKTEQNEKFSEKYNLVKSTESYNIYENPNYIPMGIKYKYYITEDEYLSLSYENKRKILLYAIVINEDDVNKFSEKLTKFDIYNFNITEEDYKKQILKLQNSSTEKFEYTTNGCELNVQSDGNEMLLLTTSYDEGWEIWCNNKKIECNKSDFALVSLELENGNNEIVLEYCPKGFKIGCIITITSLILGIIYLMISYIKRKNVK